MVTLTREPIRTDDLLDAVRSPHAGAVVLFLGTVRDLTGDAATEFLEYDAYPAMAETELAKIETAARSRWPVLNCGIVHRVGKLGVGEISVAVAVSCAHRADAFEAARFAIDTLKLTVPIWKKDVAPNGVATWSDRP